MASPSEMDWQTHTARLFRRARRRPAIVVGCALLATAMVVGVSARRPDRKPATVVLRISEDASQPARLGWTDRSLRGLVNEVAFSQTNLAALIEKRGLFRKSGKRDLVAAVATLRERINVEVIQNHALALVERSNRPRAAHVRISYEDADPARARTIALDLGQLVVATGRARQRERAEAAAAASLREVEAARAALGNSSQGDDAAPLPTLESLRPLDDPGVHAVADVPGLREALRSARARLDEAERARVEAQMRINGQEMDQSGLDIELLEPRPTPPPWPRSRKLALVGAVAAVACFPLAALMVGAFDRRVYDPTDVLHLGVSCLGHVGTAGEDA